MHQRNLLTQITIKNYIRQVKLSEAQRKKYYEWDGVTIKSGSKKLLLKYINPECKNSIIRNDGNILPTHLASTYKIGIFKGNKLIGLYTDRQCLFAMALTPKQNLLETKYFLIDGFIRDKIIANDTQAGKPKYHTINGQAFYNQTLNPFARVKVMEAIKNMYYDKFKSINWNILHSLQNKLSKSYPLYIEMEIHDTVKSTYDNSRNDIGRRWDVGNRAEPYMKGFLDFIVTGQEDIEPLIEDDDRLHVTSGNNACFIPCTELDTPKLVFKIYKDNNPLWDIVLDRL